jgi:hypothetical protein
MRAAYCASTLHLAKLLAKLLYRDTSITGAMQRSFEYEASCRKTSFVQILCETEEKSRQSAGVAAVRGVPAASDFRCFEVTRTFPPSTEF